jgi:MFS transporter, UMF1 family
MSLRLRLTPEEKSWVFYDVANSAFVLVVVTTVMPIFFKDVAAHGLTGAASTANWGFANSAASLVLAVLAPVLGTVADYRGLKKKFLLFFLVLGVVSTLLFLTVGPGDWIRCLGIYVVARIGFAGANLFYDAFLVDVADRDRMDWVSASGYAWGYVGSVVPFLAVIGLIVRGMHAGGAGTIPINAARAGFVIVAAWWLLLSFPLIRRVRQRHFIDPEPAFVRKSFGRLFRTFRDIRQYRSVFLFLVAYFFYIDGVGTIITMATSYGRDLGLGVTSLILAILMIQIVAFPCTLLYGRLAGRFSAKKMLFSGIAIYSLITLIGFFLPELSSMQTRAIMFWVLAFLVATSMGGIQALSRSFFGKLIPPDRSAEFFGFYNIFGKFAAITGPFVMGVVGHATGDSRYGVLSILILFLAGGLALTRVEEMEGH